MLFFVRFFVVFITLFVLYYIIIFTYLLFYAGTISETIVEEGKNGPERWKAKKSLPSTAKKLTFIHIVY